ncbi:MAG: SDR family oxidoreductase [Clostridia bacterium]|nr:SDR family oxidoreductase [Clostridia bacterium]
MGYKHLKFPEGTVFLVTGAAGFIGSNLCEAILSLGYKVRGLDNFSNGRRENIEQLRQYENFSFIEGDITDPDTCLDACDGVDYVLNQAAWGSVPRSMKMPLVYNANNVSGTMNIFDAAYKKGVKRVVYASSSSVYGDSAVLPKVEGQEGRPISPYALTKKMDEEYADLYYRVFGLETIGLRYFNVFGRRQDPHSTYAAVIPIFVKNLLNDTPSVINGDGSQTRDFTYIENVIEMNLKSCLAPKEACGEAYNVAYGENTSLNQLYDKLCALLGKDIKPNYGPSRAGDIPHSLANIDKARRLVGYDPDYDINEGLELTIEWYKEFLK